MELNKTGIKWHAKARSIHERNNSIETSKEVSGTLSGFSQYLTKYV